MQGLFVIAAFVCFVVGAVVGRSWVAAGLAFYTAWQAFQAVRGL